ncbi:MAG: C2H2-type zinc finger protein [Candidatus Parvarchaeota archaeon]
MPEDYKCPIEKCGKSFSSAYEKVRHIRDVHKMFGCPKCDEVFSKSDDLIEHLSKCDIVKAGNMPPRPLRGTGRTKLDLEEEPEDLMLETMLYNSLLDVITEVVSAFTALQDYLNQYEEYLNEDSYKQLSRAEEDLAEAVSILNYKGRNVKNHLETFTNKGIKVTEDEKEEEEKKPEISRSPKGNVIKPDTANILHNSEEYEERTEGKGEDNPVYNRVELKDTRKGKYINKFEKMQPIVLKDGTLVYKCLEEGCGRIFTSKADFARHYDTYHLKKDTTVESDRAAGAQGNNPKETEGKTFQEEVVS